MTLATHHKYTHKTEMAATDLQRLTERQLVKQDRETGGWEKTLVYSQETQCEVTDKVSRGESKK